MTPTKATQAHMKALKARKAANAAGLAFEADPTDANHDKWLKAQAAFEKARAEAAKIEASTREQ